MKSLKIFEDYNLDEISFEIRDNKIKAYKDNNIIGELSMYPIKNINFDSLELIKNEPVYYDDVLKEIKLLSGYHSIGLIESFVKQKGIGELIIKETLKYTNKGLVVYLAETQPEVRYIFKKMGGYKSPYGHFLILDKKPIMKHIKRYNEDLEWIFEEEEEETPKISEEVFYIYLIPYEDEFSYRFGNKLFRINIIKKVYGRKYRVIKSIRNNQISYGLTNLGINDIKTNPGIIKKIKQNNFYITNNFKSDYKEFNKWEFSYLNKILNINDVYIFSKTKFYI